MSTTTEPCSTGVTNELGGCEPVGTEFDPDEPMNTDSVVFTGPAVIYPPTTVSKDFCHYDGKVFYDFEFVESGGGSSGHHLLPCLPTTSTTTVVVDIADPPALPATGSGADAALIAVILLVSGGIASVIARWGKSHRDEE